MNFLYAFRPPRCSVRFIIALSNSFCDRQGDCTVHSIALHKRLQIKLRYYFRCCSQCFCNRLAGGATYSCSCALRVHSGVYIYLTTLLPPPNENMGSAHNYRIHKSSFESQYIKRPDARFSRCLEQLTWFEKKKQERERWKGLHVP